MGSIDKKQVKLEKLLAKDKITPEEYEERLYYLENPEEVIKELKIKKEKKRENKPKTSKLQFNLESNIFGILSLVLAGISSFSYVSLLNSPAINIYLMGLLFAGLGIKFDDNKLLSYIGLIINLTLLINYIVLMFIQLVQLREGLQGLGY